MVQHVSKSTAVLDLHAIVHLALQEFYAIKRLHSARVAHVKMVPRAPKIGQLDSSAIVRLALRDSIVVYK